MLRAVSLAGIPPATIKCGLVFYNKGDIATAFMGTSYLNYLNYSKVSGSNNLHPSSAAVAITEKSFAKAIYFISPS